MGSGMGMQNEQLTFAPSNNIENTLRFLRDNCPPDGYLISFSGGKDSLAVLEACKEAKVPYRYYMKITTVDPPELTKYVKRCHPECVRLPPPGGKSLYYGTYVNGLPTQNNRWCCRDFKEYGADIERGQHLLLGIRAAESNERANNWGLVRTCEAIGGYKIAPILPWSDAEVWEFIKTMGAEYCELYSQGFYRIGCIGCPMAGYDMRFNEFLRWPWAYVKYRDAVKRQTAKKKAKGLVSYISAWPEWVGVRTALAVMKEEGETKAQTQAYAKQFRPEALRWQDTQDPEYLMRRVMAWWLECPVDYWKLEEPEQYAKDHRGSLPPHDRPTCP
jgi:phosphoadenosine phosphosulfate reductase